MPALVQEMSDKEVLEEQIVENAQREDVPPLEEAEGYRALIEKHGYTPDDIAAKVGKSKRVVYERIQLCKLGKEGRKALDEERLNASVALLVARIPASCRRPGGEGHRGARRRRRRLSLPRAPSSTSTRTTCCS
jgi:ParB/RepB/Spo0J family partition protein